VQGNMSPPLGVWGKVPTDKCFPKHYRGLRERWMQYIQTPDLGQPSVKQKSTVRLYYTEL